MRMSEGAVAVDEAPDSYGDLERRLELATPADTVRGTFFLGMLEAVRALAGEEGARRCVEAGDEPRFVDFFNYPVSTFLRVNDVAAWVLAPRCGGWHQAQHHLGRRAMGDMLKSAAGRAMMLLSRGEARRLVGNLSSVYRAAVSYGERSVQWEGASRGRVLMYRDFMPCAFHEGVLLALLEDMKVRAVEVRGTRLDVLESEYLVSWQ